MRETLVIVESEEHFIYLVAYFTMRGLRYSSFMSSEASPSEQYLTRVRDKEALKLGQVVLRVTKYEFFLNTLSIDPTHYLAFADVVEIPLPLNQDKESKSAKIN